MTDEELVAFLQRALPHMRMRWPGFRKVRRQVRKRLLRRMRELELRDLHQYEAFLASHPGEWDTLDGMCRITISRFYRDRAVFDALRAHLLPSLARARLDRGEHELRAWCAGCASGEEPYSLSLCWALDVAGRVGPGVRLEIVATDVDQRLIERARTACYEKGALKELPPGWVEAAFEAVGETHCLMQAYRGPVRFLLQDIRTGVPAGSFDLVLCRNLAFTYFDVELQAVILERLLAMLVPGGALVLGSHEELPPGVWPLEAAHGALPIHRRTDERSSSGG